MSEKDMADAEFRETIVRAIAEMVNFLDRGMSDLDEEKKKRMEDLLTFCKTLLAFLPSLREQSKERIIRDFIIWIAAEIVHGPERWGQLMFAASMGEFLEEKLNAAYLMEQMKAAKENGTIQ